MRNELAPRPQAVCPHGIPEPLIKRKQRRIVAKQNERPTTWSLEGGGETQAHLERRHRDGVSRLARGIDEFLAQAPIIADMMQGNVQTLRAEPVLPQPVFGDESIRQAPSLCSRLRIRKDREKQPLRPFRPDGKIPNEIEYALKGRVCSGTYGTGLASTPARFRFQAARAGSPHSIVAQA